jgi:hypothetical protein
VASTGPLPARCSTANLALGYGQPLNGPAAPADGGGLPSLSYCQGGANDPGQDIAVSPFEATETGALAH